MSRKRRRPIRSQVVRFSMSDVVYFITTNTHLRQPIFADAHHVEILRERMRKVQKYHPFKMRGYVFIPDHLHLLIYVPDGTDISKLMQSIKRNFTRNYKDYYGLDESLKLWQRSFYDHVIRDERDYWNHLDYIHYNPVKHGYVKRPEDYPHSSFMDYVRLGWYELGWGHADVPYDDLHDGRLWEWGE